MSTIPYTHWAYFPDQAKAHACATELNELGCLVRVDAPEAELETGGYNAYPGWLLRASRDVVVDELVQRHEEAEAIVVRHDGTYDGGESGWLDVSTGQPAFGSAADEFFAGG
jgi:hypothetical protein